MALRYIPEQLPVISSKTREQLKDIVDLIKFLHNEILNISQVINDHVEVLREEQHVDVTKKRTGLVKFFDGVNFNPGAGKGLYIWANDRWEKL